MSKKEEYKNNFQERLDEHIKKAKEEYILKEIDDLIDIIVYWEEMYKEIDSKLDKSNKKVKDLEKNLLYWKKRYTDLKVEE